jgi:hypothetical protein
MRGGKGFGEMRRGQKKEREDLKALGCSGEE